MREMVRHSMAHGVDLQLSDFNKQFVYKACIQGKMPQKAFPKVSNMKYTPFELVSADLFSPTRTPTLNGKCYVLTLKDTSTCYVWSFFLHTKDETAATIKHFIAHVQTQHTTTIKAFHTDNRGHISFHSTQTSTI
jgi:hypothetical protein